MTKMKYLEKVVVYIISKLSQYGTEKNISFYHNSQGIFHLPPVNINTESENQQGLNAVRIW